MRYFIQDLNVHAIKIFFYMGAAYHLTTIGEISNVTTSYWVENVHFSFFV